MQPFIEDKFQSVAERSVNWSNWSIDLEYNRRKSDMLITDLDKCLHSNNQQVNFNDVNKTPNKCEWIM